MRFQESAPPSSERTPERAPDDGMGLPIPRDAHAPGIGRVAVAEFLGDHPKLTEAQLIASELLTNAHVHGGGPEVTLMLGREARSLYVAVLDDGDRDAPPAEVEPIPFDEPVGPDSERGRGLPTVRALCGPKQCGGSRTHFGTWVWARLEW